MFELFRLAGAILLKHNHTFYLIGNLKEPCNFNEYGFKDTEVDPLKNPYITLNIIDETKISLFKEPTFIIETNLSIEEVAKQLANKLLIKRNGSVSERLWNLIKDNQKNQNITWLIEIPNEIWEIVRENVLKCV
ncbi:MAG: hypothetical protein KatS3mg129_3220 [Leptospiraceae bacterium]|nr:MAG: hypothetical protein KatS3mg129_3220 [Leptospiraceae bacterium]